MASQLGPFPRRGPLCLWTNEDDKPRQARIRSLGLSGFSFPPHGTYLHPNGHAIRLRVLTRSSLITLPWPIYLTSVILVGLLPPWS
jgi:hypothetical protein